MSEIRPFTVIIIGGSVAGLTLANILERYEINYVLLEKYQNIAPQLGASIGILPYGSQLLEQLGVYETIVSMADPVDRMRIYGPDGTHLNKDESGSAIGKVLEELSGYKMAFLDRRELIQSLFDNLKDKSKIHISSELLKIEQLNGEVKIATKSGTTFVGDIIVGADGVHSRTRGEMWRIADSESPDYDSAKVSQSITCTYKCMFGIADRPEGVSDGTGFKTYHKNHSYLYQTGKEGKMYFFGFLKNPEKKVYPNIPQYTSEDQEAVAAQYGNDILFPGLTFGELYNQRRDAVLVPLQEYVMEKPSYKRAILVGDSYHKMNPLTGQGGNSAIESASHLADLLKEVLDKDPQPSNDTIQAIFAEYHRRRQPRTKALMEGAHSMQRVESLENPFLEILNLKVMSKLGFESVAPKLADISSPGHILRYLPSPPQRGAVAVDEHVRAKPGERPLVTTFFGVVVMLFIACLGPIISRHLNFNNAISLGGPAFRIYIMTLTIAINGLWVVESYRPGLLISPLFSAIPYVLASATFGWEIIVPLYFAIYMYQSHGRSFYYPSPRAIHLGTAKALPTGLLVAYILPIIEGAASLALNLKNAVQIGGWTSTAAHFILPLVLYVGKRSFVKASPDLKLSEKLYGSKDLPYLSQFYSLLFLLASTAHLVAAGYIAPQVVNSGLGSALLFSPEALQALCIALATTFWCLFTVWDLCRVKVFHTSLLVVILGVLAGVVLLGPAATLIGVWGLRELALENSRKLK